MINKTLREISGEQFIAKKDASPLEQWYGELLGKTLDEISLADVSRMLRQNVLPEIAIPKAINILSKDPFDGEFYDGELLKHLSDALSKSTIEFDHSQLQSIVKKADSEKESFDWGCEDDKRDFEMSLNKIRRI